ncbi:DUF4347 domain-containing protein [Acidovorax sp.]|uniref:DUF4347 domain-containing protein n=1 Tax=Acidovorax sp. TaxID=1872122 RepID=UPI003CFEA343
MTSTLTNAETAAREIVFVDSRVKDTDTLLKGFSPNAQVVYLKAGEDGLKQMAAALSEHGDVGAVHVLAHGSEGQMWLGTTFLDASTLAGHSETLAAIGRGMTADGDLLVYACNLAQGEVGAQFVSSLAALTGADVAASDNRTGAGGDWDLEIATGHIEAAPGVSGDTASNYQHALATLTVTSNADSGATTLRGLIASATSGDTITFNAGMTVTLTTGQLAIGKNLIIDGDLDDNGTPDVTIDANHASRVINISTGSVQLDGLTIKNGLTNGAGGNGSTGGAGANGSDGFGAGINNSGTLLLTNSVVIANKASGGGGGGGSTNGLYAGGGGGGGGFGTGNGAAGGVGAGGQAPGAISGITGGSGGGAGGRGGGGGNASGGAASTYSGTGYTLGGAGATANNGSFGIGGGGGGTGTNRPGGSGGNSAGAIYNNSAGTVTILNSSIQNNIGAGGGGGGGGSANYASTGNGGNGGRGAGGIWNANSSANSVKMDAGTYASMATGNKGAGGSFGTAIGGTNTNGTIGTGNDKYFGLSALNNTYSAASITNATYDAATGVLSVTAAGMTNGDTIDVTKLSLTGQGGSYTLTAATTNPTASSATAFTVTLGAVDKLAINGILNTNGTSAVDTTVFNLAAAANWDQTSSSSADLTGNGVTVSNVTAPTITSASYDAATGILTVTGTGLVKVVGATNDITVNKLRIVGEGGTGRTLVISSNVEVTDATSFAVQLSGNDRIVVDSLLNKNGATSSSGSTYNVVAFDDWNSTITNGDIADATNPLTVSNVPAPTITSATYDASTGTLSFVGTGLVQLTGVNNDIIANKFTLTGEGGATYTLTDTANVDIATTSNTAFTLTLSATDKSGINQIINKNGSSSTGGTTYNVAAAEDWAAGANAAVVVADLTGNGVTATVAAPTVTSATYDASTGTLVVTGTGFTHRSGATNDIIANKFTLTGQGGGTYTLTDTSNVEITSDTGFTLTLSATDKAGLRTLATANGTQSAGGTTYNLAAADDWANGADAVLNIADTTGNGITVSNVVSPTLTSATYDAATGILSVTGTGMVTGDAIDVSKLSLTGQAGSYNLTSTNVTATSATAFSVTLNAADKLALNGVLNNNGTTAVDTTTFNLAGATGWNSTVGAAADLTGNGVTVSNVAAPTVTSATYDGTTNTLVVTGTGLVKTIGATNDVTVNKLTITGEGGATRTLTTTGNVEVTSATSFTVTLTGADIAGVASLLNKNGTSSASSATTYNIAAADDWNSVVTGGNIADLTGNGITVANAAPSILSSTYDAATGILSVSAVNIVGGDTIDVSKLSVTGQAGSYTLTTANVTASSSTAFAVTLNAADKLAINGILNTNGTSAVDTTVFNLAAAASWDATTTSGADLTGNGVTVSNVAAPTVTSATYDGTTNTLVVTGTGLVKTIGATNDITVNKLTITGEGGATYTLSTSGNVEVTSATSFTVTLTGADIAGVASLLNKNGTSSASSATTYNIAAADDWNSVITGGNIADLTGNGITVANAAPSILSSTYDAATGILSVSAVNIVTGDTIDVSKLSVVGQGGGSYTLTSGNVAAASATAFSVTLNAADKLAVGGLLNKAGTTAADATTFNLAAAASWDATTTSGADLTGNAVTASNVSAPTITSATYDATTHVLTVTGTGLVQTLGATNDVTVAALTITGEGGTTRSLSTTGNVEVISGTSFAVTLAGADQVAVEALFNKNGTTSTSGTTYNLAAADDWNSPVTGGDIADATSPITVSNVAVPTITSSVYNANTGVLTVTGTGLTAASGAVNDIVANKLSLQGEGGASYTLTTTSNVEITSGTSFTLTLSAADRLGANLIMNKNGTSSTSVNTYNLIAAEDWAAGADAAVVVADLTGNGVTVTNVVAPTVTSATYNVATGVLVVTGNNFLSLTGANNDITANRIRFLGEGAFNYTLTNTPNVDITSNTSFTMTMSANDKAQLALRLNKDGTSSTDATTYNIGMLEDWNTGAAVAVVIADLFGNSVTVSGNNVAPAVSGVVAGQAVNDNATISPFAGIVISDPDVGASETVIITLDMAAKGAFTAASLTASGFSTADGGLTYTHAAGTPAAIEAALRALVFKPAVGRVAPGATETTTFTISVNDGIASAVLNNTTTVVSTAIAVDSGGGTPPATTIDGVPVTTESGPAGSTIITVPVVLPTRPDTAGTPTPLADIPIVKAADGHSIVSVSVPTGVGLSAEGLSGTSTGSAALAELGFRIERVTGNTPELTNAGQVFYATLGPNEPLSVQILKPTAGVGFNPSVPLVINGSANPADGKQAVIIDARGLPAGSVIQVDNIEFIAVVGNVRVIGGAGQNMASGDSGAQWIVLGPDDDIIHGGGGNDVVGSEAGDDQVYGDAGDDIVFGGAGNDLLSGGTGSDRLNGGTGFDVAIQEGARADYTVTLEGAGIKLTHTATGVSDWLVDVEQVRFATGPSLTVAHSAAEEAGAYLFQKWIGRDLNQGEGAIIQSLTGKTALEVATLFAQVFPEQSAGKTPAQLLEGMGAAGAVRVDAVRDVTVTGDAGNNTITPTLGLARYVDGGAGIDTVVIPATLGQTYVQSQNNGTFTLQRLTDGAMLDVTRVERVTFNDTKLALDLNGHAGEAAKLLGALGGPALLTNKGVVGEVIRLLDAGASSQTIAGLGLQLLGASTPTQIAQTLWTNVVGRAGTDGELKLLTDIMAGGVSASELTVMAANLELNAVRIDLVGLAGKGIEFA